MSDPVPPLAGIPPSGRNYIFIQYSQKTCPACRTLSRQSGNSTIRAELYLYSILPKNMSCVSDPVPPEREFHHPGGIISLFNTPKKHVLRVGPCPARAGIPPSGRNYIFIQYSQKTCPACRTLSRQSGNSTIRAELYLYSILPKNMSCVSDPVPPEREFHHPGFVSRSFSEGWRA